MATIGGCVTMVVAALTLVAASPADDFTPTATERERLDLMSKPESWFIQNLAGPREVVDGQHLDPKLQYHFEARRRRPAETVKRGLDLLAQGDRGARSALARDWALLTRVTAPMRKVEDRTVAGRGGAVPIRIYTPETDEPGALPVLIYFHGGGFIYSSIEAADRATRLMANEGRVIVVSVDYRLSPENKWPAAHDDGEDVFRWTRANAKALGGDPAMVGVGGDSAGGNISVAISLRQLRARLPVPAYQLLYYGATGFGRGHRSADLFGKGYGLDNAFRQFIVPLVYGDQKTAAKAAAEFDGSMAGMPATIVVTAGFDILRDNGQELAQRLAKDGVPVTYLNYPTLTHGFLQWSGVVEDANRAATDTARLYGTAIRSRAQMVTAR